MTSKKTQPINFSHINNMVVDSKFEALISQFLKENVKKIRLNFGLRMII